MTSLASSTLKNSVFSRKMSGGQVVLLVYGSRYCFIVCVEINNALAMTIYFPSVIRGSSSDKSRTCTRAPSPVFSSFFSLRLLPLPYSSYYHQQMTDYVKMFTASSVSWNKFYGTVKVYCSSKYRVLRNEVFLHSLGTNMRRNAEKNALNANLESFQIGKKFLRTFLLRVYVPLYRFPTPKTRQSALKSRW